MYDYGIPNCVSEYFREKLEREEHEAELHEKRKEYYNANKEKMKKAYEAGFSVLPYGGYDECQSCKDADHDTQTNDDDDFGNVICHNPNCERHRPK